MLTNLNLTTGAEDTLHSLRNSLRTIEEEANIKEVKEVNKLLKKYDVVLSDDMEEFYSITQYEMLYDELKECFNTNKEGIKATINTFKDLKKDRQFKAILNKKKANANQIIDCVNKIVERIRELEINIYKRRLIELDNMRVERYNDIEMNIINKSMGILKGWCNKNTSKVIFDSKVKSDNIGNVFCYKTYGKSNLYFILSDQNKNMFGGFVSKTINKLGWINDSNSYILSLTRNGVLNQRKYSISDNENRSFQLHYDDPDGLLFNFGNDIGVCKKYTGKYVCGCNDHDLFYDHRNEQQLFTDIILPQTVDVKTNSVGNELIERFYLFY